MNKHTLQITLALVSLIALPGFLSGNDVLQSVPLTSSPSQELRFTSIPSSESGLTLINNYDDPSMWTDKFDEFQGGAIGTGIAAGDVDGDGMTDIYVVNKNGANKLYRQVSDFQFEDITEAAGVPGGNTWGTGASLADVDNDGDLDLYVCHFNSPNLLYINNGSGQFEEIGQQAGVDLVSGSVVGTFDDYDHDGDLDLFVLTNVLDAIAQPMGEPDYLFQNNGDGTFTNVTEKSGIESLNEKGHSATWWDSNEDGWMDLYISNDFEGFDHMYRNNGDGTFTDTKEEQLPHTPWFSMGADYADINNDGLFDFFAADMASTTHFKAKVAMGDMGGLVDYMDTLVTPQYMVNSVYINSGTERFMEGARLLHVNSTDWTWSPRFEDLDNDGWVDLHVTNGMVRSFTDSDMRNRAKKMRSKTQVVGMVKQSPVMEESNLTFRNTGDWEFKKVGDEWGLKHEGVSFGSAIVDLDRDGDMDIIYSNFQNEVSLYKNNTQANSVIIELKGTESNSHGVGARLFAYTNTGVQSRTISVVRGVLSSSEALAHFGLGETEVLEKLEIKWPSGKLQVFENLPANRHYTISESNNTTQTVSEEIVPVFSEVSDEIGLTFENKELLFNDMIRQSLLPNRMNTLGAGIAWGDADGDGDQDVYFAGARGDIGDLYLNNRDGTFTIDNKFQPWKQNINSEEMSAIWLDANSDGSMDLFVSSGSVEVNEHESTLANKLYINNGHGVFSNAHSSILPGSALSSSVSISADFDKDGDVDIFIGSRVIIGAYPKSHDSALLKNEEGVYTESGKSLGIPHLGMVTAAVWSDANDDSWLDLIVVGEFEPMRVFYNHEGKYFKEASDTSYLDRWSGWWNSLEAADVDGDGDIDYVVGNVGLNTKYHANEEHPYQVFYGDFQGDGERHIVEAKYEGDSLFPVRGLSCSSRAMPAVREEFPTFKQFGSALLDDIYDLENSDHYKVTTLEHGVFYNTGNESFEFKPLPRLSQISPVFGTAVRDFNGDGIQDIFMIQNFRGPQVETGRFDGGLGMLLLGKGNGEFETTFPGESGINVSEEGRAATVADWNNDGWPDVLVSCINSKVLAFQTTPHAEGNSFAVKLSGNKKITTGAKITVTYLDNTQQVVELNSGSGYLSQSADLAFFSYTGSNTPAKITVAWPSGETTQHPWNDAPTLEL